ncbi:serine--tRNA ligase, mitochondrial [Cephus cinctus]|uniref:serine--tRNA ligase n=1 Tax=Cephus cinctus TaxID=211228 RepID=A0AAJ7RCR5_CEPCN|nr:serine--tRNA ligase, mitochondrial [Cephus cinctus]
MCYIMNLRPKLFAFSLIKRFSTQVQTKAASLIISKHCMPEPEYNIEYLCNEKNRDAILNNIMKRKGVGDIDKVLELSKKLDSKNELLLELSKIPNCTDPQVLEYGDEPQILKISGSERKFDFKPQEFSVLAGKLKLLRTENLGPFAGHKSYILLGDLAELEQALIHYSIRKLMVSGFKLVSVPDILPTAVIERCGLIVNNERTLVYTLDPCYGDKLGLSGTAEMSLANKLTNTVLSQEKLPLKLAAVSRCFRAETSKAAEERGIYRVHQFTKVEMFACSEQEKSSDFLSEIQSIQEDMFTDLNLHFKVLDMPPYELGAPAYRKLDIEGWMPGRGIFGELSSCSNCTDYQSRRLNIKYKTKNGETMHVHTLNGTACAIPRMLIAICETHQTKDGNIKVPSKLVPYMKGKTIIEKQPIADTRTYKYKPKIN